GAQSARCGIRPGGWERILAHRTGHPGASGGGLALGRSPAALASPQPWVPESRVDSVSEAFADFVDLKSPFTPPTPVSSPPSSVQQFRARRSPLAGQHWI